MNKFIPWVLSLSLTCMLTGCSFGVLDLVSVGTGDTYDWHGAYFKQLYLNRGSMSEKEYAEFLQEIADDVDPSKPNTLPPGFYAGLGLAWSRAGDSKKAAFYLKKEAEIWPEGKVANEVAKWIEEEDFTPELRVKGRTEAEAGNEAKDKTVKNANNKSGCVSSNGTIKENPNQNTEVLENNTVENNTAENTTTEANTTDNNLDETCVDPSDAELDSGASTNQVIVDMKPNMRNH